MLRHLRDPIIVPRWLLVVQYALFIGVGLAIAWATSPSFSAIAPGSWSEVWAIGLSASSAVALIGSTRKRWESLERWACLLVCGLLFGYAFAPIILLLQGDADRTVYSTMALILSLLPSARLWYLLRRAGTDHHEGF
jgi:hypothetical protein